MHDPFDVEKCPPHRPSVTALASRHRVGALSALTKFISPKQTNVVFIHIDSITNHRQRALLSYIWPRLPRAWSEKHAPQTPAWSAYNRRGYVMTSFNKADTDRTHVPPPKVAPCTASCTRRHKENNSARWGVAQKQEANLYPNKKNIKLVQRRHAPSKIATQPICQSTKQPISKLIARHPVASSSSSSFLNG
ncbi:unnamed protein product [Ectocarpus sp. 13 AM-2016]